MREVLATRGDLHSDVVLTRERALVTTVLNGFDFEAGLGILEPRASFRDVAPRLVFGAFFSAIFPFRFGTKTLRDFEESGDMAFAALPVRLLFVPLLRNRLIWLQFSWFTVAADTEADD